MAMRRSCGYPIRERQIELFYLVDDRGRVINTINPGAKFALAGQTFAVPGDVLAWKESSKQRDFSQSLTEGIPVRPVPEWLALDTATLTGHVIALPEGDQLETRVDTRLIVEFYSR